MASDIAEEIRRQYRWRSWPAVYAALGELRGARVLDLGCGVGDQTADLIARGAEVTGLDLDPTLLDAARAAVPGAAFVAADIADPASFRGRAADGVWISFALAYVRSLPGALAAWAGALVPGGWLAVTEVDDLFGHEPLSPAHRARVESYYDDARRAGRYQFRSRASLRAALADGGWAIEVDRELPDAELAFAGPAGPDVIAAWAARLDRMALLAAHFGDEWPGFRAEFLAALAAPAHRSLAAVWFILARRPHAEREE
jgi:trans-aconitate methyltransferase